MAAMLALSRTSSALSKILSFPILRPTAASAFARRRPFTTDIQLRHLNSDDDDDEEEDELDYRSFNPTTRRFFNDEFDPLVYSLNPFLAAAAGATPRGGAGAGFRRSWDVKQDKEALRLRVDMPGVGKEHVKVRAEKNTLVVEGEVEEDSSPEDGARPMYGGRVVLPADEFKMDAIRAEMKNGVLKVVVPKVKAEERKDVIQVKVE